MVFGCVLLLATLNGTNMGELAVLQLAGIALKATADLLAFAVR